MWTSLNSKRFVGTWSSYRYKLFFHIDTNLEVHTCLGYFFSLYFISLELRNPNLLQHDNVPVHKFISLKLFEKAGVEENLGVLQGALNSTPINTFGMNWKDHKTLSAKLIKALVTYWTQSTQLYVKIQQKALLMLSQKNGAYYKIKKLEYIWNGMLNIRYSSQVSTYF